MPLRAKKIQGERYAWGKFSKQKFSAAATIFRARAEIPCSSMAIQATIARTVFTGSRRA